MNKWIRNIKREMKYNSKIKYYIIISVVVLVLLIIFLFKFTHMTKVEKELLKEDSNRIMLYMDSIENNKSEDEKHLDSYVLYALEYAYNEKGKEYLTSKEIKKIIEDNFDMEIKVKDINNVGISPLLLDKGVMHDPENNKYGIDRSNMTQRQIADIPIVVYKIKSMKKRGSNYVVKYKKVTIKNPYEILNYYSDLNSKNQLDQMNSKKKKKKEVKEYDTSKIMNYLTVKGKIKDVKLAVNDEIIKEDGKVAKKKVKVIYKLKGTKYKVKRVK